MRELNFAGSRENFSFFSAENFFAEVGGGGSPDLPTVKTLLMLANTEKLQQLLASSRIALLQRRTNCSCG